MTRIRYGTGWFCLFGVLAKILRSYAYVPPKTELGDQSIVVPPKSMGGNLCVSCSKPKIMKLKVYLCLVQSPRDEAKRCSTERICYLYKKMTHLSTSNS